MKPLIAPSLLSADFLNLGQEIDMLNRSEADWIHLDIMDGEFVPNISFGFPVMEKIRQKAAKPLDVHLMIVNPDRYIDRFASCGAHQISVHYEACTHLHRTLGSIRQTGAKAGVVLNPHTPVCMLTSIIRDVDLVLIMSVNPGFGGQKFIPESYSRIRELKQMILEKKSSALIEVDGGVDLENAPRLVECGTDVLVAGNTVFSSPNPEDTIHRLKSLEK
jgi:ribulose-phosphate 3-epimerase